MKKRRTTLASSWDLPFEIPLPAAGADAAMSALLAKELVKADVQAMDIEHATEGQPVQFEIPPPGGAIDLAFDPWQTEFGQVVTSYGLKSPEMGAWCTAQAITANRDAIESDGRLLLEAVAKVLDYGLQSPDWLGKAYRKRLAIFQTYETATLDRAFGLSPPTERSRRVLHSDRQLRGRVHAALLDRLRQEPDRPIDNSLWEEVGEQFGIGKDKCEKLYLQAVAEDHVHELVAFRRLLKAAQGIPPK